MPDTPHDLYRTIASVHRGVAARDGAGVNMTRIIATPELADFDPFLLLDEFRSDDPDDYIAGFPDHPHRGFETVTYMLAGAMEHRDNQGNRGLLGPGSVQWMTAGRGIVHAEMPRQQDGLMWGFQLWVNLPASDKMTTPRYQDIAAADIPVVNPASGVQIRVVAGEAFGRTGPVGDVATRPLYLDVGLDAENSVELPVPRGHNAFVYVFQGDIDVQGRTLQRGDIGLTGGEGPVVAVAGEDARFLLVAGMPLNEPVARYGPFVMNTEAELRQAFADFQSGRF